MIPTFRTWLPTVFFFFLPLLNLAFALEKGDSVFISLPGKKFLAVAQIVKIYSSMVLVSGKDGEKEYLQYIPISKLKELNRNGPIPKAPTPTIVPKVSTPTIRILTGIAPIQTKANLPSEAKSSQVSSPNVTPNKTTHCWVVSGTDHDKGFKMLSMDPMLDARTSRIPALQKDCKVFSGWEQLNQYFKKEFIEGNKSPDQHQILIYQGAHGASGGHALCNDGLVKGQDITKHLQEISSRYQTSAWIKSCYSGDLLVNKLIQDQETPQSKSIDNLCLVTYSYVGQSTMMLHSVGEEVKKGENAEDLFRRKFIEDGMISSAAWTDSHFDVFASAFASDDAVLAALTLKNHTSDLLEKFNMGLAQCSLDASPSSRLSISPCFSDLMLEFLLEDHESIPAISSTKNYEDYLNQLKSLHYFPKTAEKKGVLERIEKLSTAIQGELEGEDERTAIAYLSLLKNEIKSLPQNNIHLVKLIEIGKSVKIKVPCPFEIYGVLSTSFDDPKLEKEMAPLVDSINLLRDHNDNENEITEANNMIDSIKAAVSSQRPCPIGANLMTIDAIIRGKGKPQEDAVFKAARGFALGSLQFDHFVSSLDNRRRKACRNFIFNQ